MTSSEEDRASMTAKEFKENETHPRDKNTSKTDPDALAVGTETLQYGDNDDSSGMSQSSDSGSDVSSDDNAQQLVDEKEQIESSIEVKKLVFTPNLEHSNSLVISEIDSGSSNDLQQKGEEVILASTDDTQDENVEEKVVNNKSEKEIMKEESPDGGDVNSEIEPQATHPKGTNGKEEIDVKSESQHPGNDTPRALNVVEDEYREEDTKYEASNSDRKLTQQRPQHLEPMKHENLEDDVSFASEVKSNSVPRRSIEQLPLQPQNLSSAAPSRNSFVDLNTPVLMVMPQQMQHMQQQMQMQQMQQINFVPPQANGNSGVPPPMYTNGGTPMMTHPQQNIAHVSSPPTSTRRRMRLRLVETLDTSSQNEESGSRSLFSKLYRPKTRARSFGSSEEFDIDSDKMMAENGSPARVKTTEDRGYITVSWFDGTNATELKDHVRKSISTQLRLGRKKLVLNIRVIDESVYPHEEIVLSPHIPDGSKFLLKFRIKDLTLKLNKQDPFKAPPSPSAAPSPPGELEQELQRQISDVLSSKENHNRSASSPPKLKMPDIPALSNPSMNIGEKVGSPPSKNDAISERLEKLNETLLLLHEEGTWAKDELQDIKTEKKQVIFVLANYFVLFLSLIAISAEIHERAPNWVEQMQENYFIVQNCAAGKDELFQCVSEGNFSGLVASVILWASKSVATKRFFLFGFDSPQKLWTVVYEAGVTAICWGTSYLAIRRGLNPDTRQHCLSKYWKDAVYGSLAGFNAAFMKAVLKNLLPQADEILDVMEHRQIRLFNFIGRALQSEVES